MYMYMCIVYNPYPIMFPSLPWHRPSHRAIDDPRDQAEAQTIRQGWDAKLVRGDGGGVGVLAPQHLENPGKNGMRSQKNQGKPRENGIQSRNCGGFSLLKRVLRRAEADERRQILGRPRNSP